MRMGGVRTERERGKKGEEGRQRGREGEGPDDGDFPFVDVGIVD
jgi:hypothetical protein